MLVALVAVIGALAQLAIDHLARLTQRFVIVARLAQLDSTD